MCQEVGWPSGLRRWFKAPVISMAWVRIPPLPKLFFPLFFLHITDIQLVNLTMFLTTKFYKNRESKKMPKKVVSMFIQEDRFHPCTHFLGIQRITEFSSPDGCQQFEVAPAVLEFSVLVSDVVCCKMVT